jgi:hypothetical protein
MSGDNPLLHRCVRQCVYEFISALCWVIPSTLSATSHLVHGVAPSWFEIALITTLSIGFVFKISGGVTFLHPFFILNYMIFGGHRDTKDKDRYGTSFVDTGMPGWGVRFVLGIFSMVFMFLGMLTAVLIVYELNGNHTIVETEGPATELWSALIMECVFSLIFVTAIHMLKKVYKSDLCLHTPGDKTRDVSNDAIVILCVGIFIYMMTTGVYTGGNFNIGLLFAKAAISKSGNPNIWLHVLVQFFAFTGVGLVVKVLKPKNETTQ